MISNRVMKINEFEDSVFYRVACSCGSDDHGATIEIEHDKEIPKMIFVNFYKKIAWCSRWGNINWYQQIWKRVKCSLVMLFTGYIELEDDFILEGEDHIDSFIEALEEGKKLIKGE